MVFYLSDLQKQGRLIWGAGLTSLRVGVAHELDARTGNKGTWIEVFLQNLGTNDLRQWNLRLPRANEQFDVSLYDSGGKEVPKTVLGRQQGQPLSMDGQDPRKTQGAWNELNVFLGGHSVRRSTLRPVFLSEKDATVLCRLNVNDYFEIKSPGKYRLTYQQRLYRRNTNSTLTGITMPMVTVPLDISHIPGQ